MRCLIVRFIDCEGPGIFEEVLREKGYAITFHDAYKKGLSLVPEAHQVFDLILLMGGPQSLANPEEKSFFKPYLNLVEDALALTGHKVVGVCLGAQIIAKVLGEEIRKGEKGKEFGFGTVQITQPNHPVFKGVDVTTLPVFHFHEDTYNLPKDATELLKSEMYANQMFVYKNQALGIQCHIEMTLDLLDGWRKRFSDVAKLIPSVNDKIKTDVTNIQKYGKQIFENILSL